MKRDKMMMARNIVFINYTIWLNYLTVRSREYTDMC